MAVRLSRQQRREQLIELGVQLVAARSFDEVSIDDVAAAAGISRSLLFHYFPTKRDFQVAVAERGAQELLEATALDPDLTPLEQLDASLHAYATYVEQRRDSYLALVRGATSGDEGMRAVYDRTRQQIADRVLEGIGMDPDRAPVLLRVAVRGWVAFVEETFVVWLDRDAGIPRERLIALARTGLLQVGREVLGDDAFAEVLAARATTGTA